MPLLSEALELNDGLPGLTSNVAQVQFLNGNRAYALQLIDRALKEYPALVLPYEIKARMLGDLGRTSRFGALEKQMELGKTNVDAKTVTEEMWNDLENERMAM